MKFIEFIEQKINTIKINKEDNRYNIQAHCTACID